MKFFVSKFNNSLVCTDGFNFDKLTNNKIYEVTVRTYRNIKYHSKVFALLNKFCESNGIDDVDKFREDYTIKAGYYTIDVTPSAERLEAMSWSFQEMTEQRFNSFMVAFNEVLFNDFGCNLDDVENESITKD